MPKSEVLPLLFAQLLFFKELWEWFAFVALDKRATVRELFPSLFKKIDRERFTIFLSKSHFRSQKTSNSLKKPMSKFPTLDRQHLQNWKDTTVETGYFMELVLFFTN